MQSSASQHTLKNCIRATGVGLHSGRQINIVLRPGVVDSGIVFCRTDLDYDYQVRAHALNVGSTTLATSLTDGVNEISTIEHLMSAFSGLGVDNAVVEVDAGELPIMDGSAAPFVFLIQSAGVIAQNAAKKFLVMRKTIRFGDGEAYAELQPDSDFVLKYTLDYDHPVFAQHEHTAEVKFCSTSFVKEISRARTFGFLADYERLKAQNLAQGGSLRNAVVVDDSRILNAGGLRVRDEFAKHKLLDAVGDLYLIGFSLVGRFHGYRSGHTTNNGLLKKVLATPDAFEVVCYDSDCGVPHSFQRNAALPA
ncbi:MAG: UDP-3-O-acyl-N-acetylglucosamine deacetylase [Candidatus Azotimanducaceae bacterium]|jgi:UDP-3-O-[3-hydroxymyristoyl] N-acetylglucosamine deacetylase